ncbi:MAG TPA: GNAT family protein [Patescibacteria group bacterium]|nr:GNAT family protein [Patescibacteria group bacterium]
MFILNTSRLIIRDHIYEDLNTMHTLLSDPKAMYFIQDLQTYSINETYNNLKTAIESIDESDRTKYFFRIELRDGTYVGEIGFTVKFGTPLGKIVELGYFILPQYWGQAITTEAAAAVIRFAFEKVNVIKVEVGCIKDNIGSERVMEKLKMIKEADYTMKVWHDNRLRGRVEYRLTKEEWLDINKLK